MREIEFQEVGMENYGPYIDPMIHTFQSNVLTLLTGPNGVGKTLSLEAIPFTLYGVTSKKVKGDDLVNNVVGKNCKTWVNFKVNDDQYIVTRYHKYTKIGNTVIINKNGIDIMKGHREVVPEIERLLCPQKAFMNTLMFGQKVKDFFTDLVDSDKKEIFRKIIGLEQYTIYYKQADYKLKVAQTERDVATNDIKINQAILTDTLEQIETFKNAKKIFYENVVKVIKEYAISKEDNQRLLKEWEKKMVELQENDMDIESTNKQLSEVESHIKNSSTKLNELTNQLKHQTQSKVSELKSFASTAKIEVKNIASKDLESMNETKSKYVQESNDMTTDFHQQMYKLDLEKDNISFEIESLLERLEEIETNVMETENSTCPMCEQEVSDEAKEKLINKVTLYKGKVRKFSQKQKECEDKRNELAESLKAETEKYDSMIAMVNREISRCKQEESEEYEKIEYRFKIATEKVDELVSAETKKIESRSNEQTHDLQENLFKLNLEKSRKEELIEEVKQVQTRIDNFERAIVYADEQTKVLETETYDETQLNSYIKKEIDLTQSIMDYEEKIISIDNSMEMLQFWKTGFSPTGMPSMLIDESIPFMNKKVSEYLDMLTNGRYIVSFDTLDETKSGEFRDKISVRVVDTHTQANSRVQLSGGQTRIVDIATILTLGDLQSTINDVKFNILLFDEIFDALDYDNVGYVSKVLNKLKIGKSIFIISHQHQDQLDPDELLSLS